jgi:hypothetical protein
MNTKKRLIEFILHGHPDKFKTVLKEEITNRALDFLCNQDLAERKNAFRDRNNSDVKETIPEQIKESTSSFYPESTYQLKDGTFGMLNTEERKNISKLYENLNNNNKERLVKLLSESQESFNRIIKLAKLENKRTNHEQQ